MLSKHGDFVNNRFYRHNKILKVLSHGIAKTEQKMNIKRNNLNIYSGSALFSITDDLCNFFLSNSEKILLISRYSLAADEVVFHTLLMDSAFANRLYNFELRDGNLYYIDWNRHEGSSPCTFSKNDLEILLSLPAQYLFARKFREGYSDDLVIKLYNHLKED